MSRRTLRAALTGAALLVGIAVVAASLVVPTLLLLHTDDRTLNRWSQIGQAVSPVGVFFSGIAFIGITLTLFLQRSELQNQRDELSIAREELQRSSEIALRQLHTDLVKMAIDDPELREVWPQLAPGLQESNLILNPAEGRLRDRNDRTGRVSRRPRPSHGQPRHVLLLGEGASRARGCDQRRRGRRFLHLRDRQSVRGCLASATSFAHPAPPKRRRPMAHRAPAKPMNRTTPSSGLGTADRAPGEFRRTSITVRARR